MVALFRFLGLVVILSGKPSSSFVPPQSECQTKGQCVLQIGRFEEGATVSNTIKVADKSLSREKSGDLRKFRRTWPLWLQHGLRDTGMLRFIVDSLTLVISAPAFYYENPKCFPEFVRISGYAEWLISGLKQLNIIDRRQATVNFSIESYGAHPSQYGEVMSNAEPENAKEAPLLIFVHGGAWGSGFPAMYRLLSVPFLKKGYRVVILGYRVYPDADVEGQVLDIIQAVNHFTEKHVGPTVLMGHSSGAHIALLAAIKEQLPINALVCKSGVYDVEEHYRFECFRGVDQISPLSPACGYTLENWQRNSPTAILETACRSVLEGLPSLLFVHGEEDATVPSSASINCYEIITSRGKNDCELRVLQGTGHQETVLEVLLGGKSQDAVFDWLDSIV